MKQELTIIDEREVLGKDFKVYGDFENPLFLAKDVAEWIEYDNEKIGQMLSVVGEDEKLTSTLYRSGQRREMWFLTEDGLYEVLFQSRKPLAKQFKTEVKRILKELRTKGIVDLRTKDDAKQKIADAREMNAKTRYASMFMKLCDRVPLEPYKQVMLAYATNILTGEFLLPLPKITAHTYSATDIGKKLGISKNKVGILANKYKLKTDEYGEWVWDKSEYSDKQVESFRYYENAVEAFKAVMAQVVA